MHISAANSWLQIGDEQDWEQRESAECAHPKLIPNLQKQPEDGLLRVEGEAKVADPSSESLLELIHVRAMLLPQCMYHFDVSEDTLHQNPY